MARMGDAKPGVEVVGRVGGSRVSDEDVIAGTIDEPVREVAEANLVPRFAVDDRGERHG
jgi:hypothetical protein